MKQNSVIGASTCYAVGYSHEKMSAKALGSENVRNAILDFLLNYCGLYESLREKKVG